MFSSDGLDLSNVKASHTFQITSCKRDLKTLNCNYLSIFGFGEYTIKLLAKLARTNLFGKYEIEVTRQFGEYEFFLISNPGV